MKINSTRIEVKFENNKGDFDKARQQSLIKTHLKAGLSFEPVDTEHETNSI